jgi:ribokinase
MRRGPGAEAAERSTPGKRIEVAVLGVAAMDLVARVERLPEVDGIALARHVEEVPGGSGANVAVGLARLGHSVAFLGKVGDDARGRELLKAFEREAVDIRGLRVAQGQPSAACFVAVSEKGERLIVALGGVGALERPEELAADLLREARIVYISDLVGEVARRAVHLARQGGGMVYFSPGGVTSGLGLVALHPLLAEVDVFVGSRSDLSRLLGESRPGDAAREVLEAGAAVVVETLGAQGARLLARGEERWVPAFEVDPVVDTTGAGDAFAAGLMAGRLEGLGWERSLVVGCAVAALKIGRFGAREGLPTGEELRAFLQLRDGG